MTKLDDFYHDRNATIEECAKLVEDDYTTTKYLGTGPYECAGINDLAILVRRALANRIRRLKTNTNVIPFTQKQLNSIHANDNDDDPEPSSPAVAMRKVA